jgi:electron transport complex protein RnfG
MKYKNWLLLATIVISCSLIVVITYWITRQPIAINEKSAVNDALHRIISPYQHDNNILDSQKMLTDTLLGSKNPLPAYIAYKDNKAVAVILTVIAPDGYNGAIKLLVGVHANNHLAGVRAIAHAETPGLGDKMEERKSKWIYSFDNKSLLSSNNNKWALTKEGGEFNSWTGASITPRAIVHAVHNALVYVKFHQQELFHDQQ